MVALICHDFMQSLPNILCRYADGPHARRSILWDEDHRQLCKALEVARKYEMISLMQDLELFLVTVHKGQ